jgi:selenide,water dikinase
MLGGHSIDDPEPKFGLCVIGEVHPDRMFTNAAARPGDLLVLTKPLGTGILTTALKRNMVMESGLDEAVRSMTALNDGAARAALAAGVRCATDITGFGLLGHLGNIIAASGVGARIDSARLPLLDGALELAAAGAVPGGTQRNLEAARVEWADDVGEAERLLCVDAQTSGGLLLAVRPERLALLLDALRVEGTAACAVIGEILPDAGVLRVVRGTAEQ